MNGALQNLTRTREVNLFGYTVTYNFQFMVIAVVLFAALYAALFSGIPAIHDPMHAIRHSLGFLACH